MPGVFAICANKCRSAINARVFILLVVVVVAVLVVVVVVVVVVADSY